MVMVAGLVASAGAANDSSSERGSARLSGAVSIFGAFLTTVDEQYGVDKNSMFSGGVAIWLMSEGHPPWQIHFTTGETALFGSCRVRLHRLFLSRIFHGASERYKANPHVFGYGKFGLGVVIASFTSDFVDNIAGKWYPAITSGGGLVLPITSTWSLRIGMGMDLVATKIHGYGEPLDLLFSVHAGLMFLL
jgi:hypothetical protein